MPPPRFKVSYLPSAIVRSLMVRDPLWTTKTRLVPLPLMVRFSAPGPTMVRFEVMVSALASLMVPPSRCLAKSIVSPLVAALMTARRVPGPLSARDVTGTTLGTVRSSRIVSCGLKLRLGRWIGVRLERFLSDRRMASNIRSPDIEPPKHERLAITNFASYRRKHAENRR